MKNPFTKLKAALTPDQMDEVIGFVIDAPIGLALKSKLALVQLEFAVKNSLARLNAKLSSEQRSQLIGTLLALPFSLALFWVIFGDLYFVAPIGPVAAGVSNFFGGLAGCGLAGILQIISYFLLSLYGTAFVICVCELLLYFHFYDSGPNAVLSKFFGVLTIAPLWPLITGLHSLAYDQGLWLGPLLGLAFAVIGRLLLLVF